MKFPFSYNNFEQYHYFMAYFIHRQWNHYSIFVISNYMFVSDRFAFKFPPDKKLCQIHRQANRMFRSLSVQSLGLRCQCCGRFVAQQSSADALCFAPEKELQILGPGVPLLFVFIQNSIISIGMLIAVMGLYALVSNAVNDSCGELSVPCKQDALNNISISNKLLDKVGIQVQVYLAFAVTLLWIVVHQISIYRCRKIEEFVDQDTHTPADYAVLFRQLPENVNKIAIKQMIQRRNQQLDNYDRKITKNLQVEKVIIPFKQRDYLKKKKQQEKRYKLWLEEGQKIRSFQYEKIQKSKEKTNVAIVLFTISQSKEFFLSRNTKTGEPQNILFPCCSNLSELQIDGKTIIAQRAPEPDDIIWKNIENTNRSVLCNKVMTVGLGIALLAFGGWVQYQLAKWQLTENTQNSTIFSIFSSFIVTLTNTIIRYILVWMTKFQGNLTHTRQQQSVNFKLCYFQFFNAGIFYSLANVLAISFNQYKITDSFSLNVTTFMIMNALLPTFTTFLFDYLQFPNIVKRWMLDHSYSLYTQKEANVVYQLSDCCISDKYSYVIKTLLLTYFYVPLVPIVALISLCGLIFNYWTLKYLFRYCYKIPNIRSNETNQGSLRLTQLAPICLNICQLFIYFYILDRIQGVQTGKYYIFIFVSLSISFSYILMPWTAINSKICKIELTTSSQKYKDCFQNFQITYQKADPLYQSEYEKKTSQRDIRFALKSMKTMKEIPQSYRNLTFQMVQSVIIQPEQEE